MRFLLLFMIVTCFLQAQGADKYTDGNRPYEFGFTIDGEQHRYEKKDDKGIIMGEFGFITADGVYHVTVYATDEQGHFKIISMKNIRVKPYPTAPELKNNLPVSTLAPLQQSTTTTSKPLLRDFTPLPPSRQEKSCSHCSLPAPKVPPPNIAASKQSFIPTQSSALGSNNQLPTGPAQQYPSGQQISLQNRNSFPEINNVGNFAPNNNANPQKGLQEGLGPNYDKNNANIKLNNPVQYNAASQYPSPGNSPSNSGKNYPNQNNDYKAAVSPTGANIEQNYPETGASVYQNSPGSGTNQNYPESGSQTDQNNSETSRPLSQNYPLPGTLAGNNYPEQRPSTGQNYPAQSPNPEPNRPLSGTGTDQNNSGTNGPANQNYPRPGTLEGNNYQEQTSTTGQNYPAQGSNPESNSPLDSGSNPQNPNTNQQNPLGAPRTRDRNPKQYGYNQEPVSTAEQPFNSQNVQVPSTSSNSPPVKKPTLISAQMRIVDKNTDVHHKNPGETEGLPNGLNKDDMMRILYTFNYTVGFHGHHEEGYSNGAKVGYYYVTGRNGVRTRVDYVADKNGFRPKVTQEVLDLLSDEVPKPETEKEEKFGLKNYEFKWLYFPVESKS